MGATYIIKFYKFLKVKRNYLKLSLIMHFTLIQYIKNIVISKFKQCKVYLKKYFAFLVFSYEVFRIYGYFTLTALVAQSYPTLCNPMDCSPPGSSVHEIFQAKILEWVAISFSRGSSQLRDRTRVFCIAGRFFTDWAIREASILHLEHISI